VKKTLYVLCAPALFNFEIFLHCNHCFTNAPCDLCVLSIIATLSRFNLVNLKHTILGYLCKMRPQLLILLPLIYISL
jgi:hypothetical protein